MRNQLRRLADAIDAANVIVQVLPKSVGASPAIAAAELRADSQLIAWVKLSH